MEIGEVISLDIKYSEPEIVRGGMLDTFVSRITAGRFGVETRVTRGLKDEVSGKIFQGDPAALAFRTGEPVMVRDRSNTEHNKKQRIVRNRIDE